MSEMKPVHEWRIIFDDGPSPWMEGEPPMLSRDRTEYETRTLYDTAAFRALVERVCDPKFEGCSEFTLKLEERARIRAALLAALE